MDEQNEGAQEAVVEQEETTETPVESVEETHKEETVVLKKADFTKMNRKALAYDAKKNEPIEVKATLDVSDYIDISASLEGLDQREKEYLAEQHKYTGKPLSELRKDEDFGLWQTAYRQKVEKERLTLSPSSTQSESERPKSLTERLASASLAEKEQILAEAGLYKSPRQKSERVNIGR